MTLPDKLQKELLKKSSKDIQKVFPNLFSKGWHFFSKWIPEKPQRYLAEIFSKEMLMKFQKIFWKQVPKKLPKRFQKKTFAEIPKSVTEWFMETICNEFYEFFLRGILKWISKTFLIETADGIGIDKEFPKDWQKTWWGNSKEIAE